MAAGEYVATKSQNEVMTGELKLEAMHVRDELEVEMGELNELLGKIGIPGGDCTHIGDGPCVVVNGDCIVDNDATTISQGNDDDGDGDGDGDDQGHDYHKEQQQLQTQQPQQPSHQPPTLRNQLKEFYRSNPVALLQIMQALEFGVIEEEARSPTKAGLVSCILFIMGSLSSVIPFIFSGDRPQVGLIAAACFTMGALMLVGAVKTWATRGRCLVVALENLCIAGVGGGIAYGIGVLFDNALRP